MTLLADIFVTTKGRPDLLLRSVKSLVECTDRSLYRLTLVDDTGIDEHMSFGYEHGAAVTAMTESLAPSTFDHQVRHTNNEGLGPSINQALAHIDTLKRWDGADAPPFTVYLQDDVLYTPGWLEKLTRMFMFYERQHNLGFASGIESIEHPVKKDLGNGLLLKDWVRATCLLARHEYWMSMWPISRIDPETGRERGRPHDGLGSSVDWFFIRNHENSVCKTGRTNLVMPGLLQHVGYQRSTWLKRDLPESDSDKEKMR